MQNNIPPFSLILRSAVTITTAAAARPCGTACGVGRPAAHACVQRSGVAYPALRGRPAAQTAPDVTNTVPLVLFLLQCIPGRAASKGRAGPAVTAATATGL